MDCKMQNSSTKKNDKERRTQTERKKRNHASGKRALLYSPLAETRLTVYRQRQVKSNTGAVVASWHPGRRATIGIFDMKNKGFDEKCQEIALLIPIFHSVRYVSTNLIQIFK